MRIESIRFRNFKLLRDAVLPLEPLTVIVGPNSSGKSTVFELLRLVTQRNIPALRAGRSLTTDDTVRQIGAEIRFAELGESAPLVLRAEYSPSRGAWQFVSQFEGASADSEVTTGAFDLVASFRAFALVPDRMRMPVELTPSPQLQADGANVAAVFDALRDRDPDRWERVNSELVHWLPEFDRILFETPSVGTRSIALRTRSGGYRIGAGDLSSGTLLVLALLAILHAEDGTRLIGIEEPEIGIHPRLLRHVRDALFRIAYPAENGESREPRQVIVTTHSPYLLDLFRDDPENVVIADRRENTVTFERLSDRDDIDQIVSESSLGDAWYSGILGGVPSVG